MITINELGFGYSWAYGVFKNFTLKLKGNSICGLLGKNGEGKTTLLKIIAGLVFPTRGQCEVLSYKPQQRSPAFLQEIYFLPEHIYLPALKSKEYLANYACFYPQFNTAQFELYLKEFKLADDDMLDYILLNKLSQGQQKKFLIAFGLATNCRLFLLDEPTNGLDIPGKASFRKLLASAMNAERLFILSTHQVREVENLIDSVFIIEEKELVLHASLKTIVQQLAFVTMPNEPQPDECFYSEKQLDGYAVVMDNKTGVESKINLEVLFNAVITNPSVFQKIFAKEESAHATA